MQRFLDLFISINCSTCFRRFLRPSSGAQNCTYSVRYCQTNTAACCYRGRDGTAFHLIHDTSRLTISDAVCTVCAPDDGRRNRLKHVGQFIEINRSRKRCILLVVTQRYPCDARTYERQIVLYAIGFLAFHGFPECMKNKINKYRNMQSNL
jgi:hypothetical protein